MTEEWRDIAGYEGYYEVSDHGSVRSVNRIIEVHGGHIKSRKLKGRTLKQKTRDGGHFYVDLSRGDVVKRHWVHRLVLEAFVSPIGDAEVTRHLNGKADDNRVENLAWGTQGENVADAVRHGTHYHTSRINCPRGHPLKDPNLVDGIKRAGRRSCKACNRTHARVYKHPYLKPQFKDISDNYYASIMGEKVDH